MALTCTSCQTTLSMYASIYTYHGYICNSWLQFFIISCAQFYFGKDVWQVLQEKLTSWSAAYSSIYVISGSILDSDHDGFRDSDEDYNRYDYKI